MHHLSIIHLPALALLGIAVLASLYAGFLARRARLPSLIGYMVVGVVLGPSIFDLLTEQVRHDLSFITEIALGFVAFSIGAELSLATLRRLGYGIISIILAESFLAFAVVTGAVYAFSGDLPLALIFGSVAPASAPAGTVAVIQECRSSGSLTKALYAVVGFDDGLAIVIFGFAAAFAKSLLVQEATGNASDILPALWPPLKELALSIAVGAALGLALCAMVRKLQTTRDLLIVSFGVVLLATGLAIHLHLSLILTNMVIGFVLVNTQREALIHKTMSPLLDLMPLIFVLFFCLAGAHLDLATLPGLGLLGAVYILGRSAGLMGGAWIGATIGRVEEKLRRYIGMGILSQAGVAIGLALIVKHEFTQIGVEYDLPHAIDIGMGVLTTVTATSIVFEVVGPILTRIALQRAGEIPPDAGVSSRD